MFSLCSDHRAVTSVSNFPIVFLLYYSRERSHETQITEDLSQSRDDPETQEESSEVEGPE